MSGDAIWRKLSFGTQSRGGNRFVERLLTIIETCRRQSRSTFAYLTTVIEADLAGTQPPSLVGARTVTPIKYQVRRKEM